MKRKKVYYDKEVEEGLEEPIVAQEESPSEAGGKKKKRRMSLNAIMVENGWLRKQLPLIMLVVVFAIIAVYNRYELEQLARKKQQTQDQIEYLKEEGVKRQRQYQQNVKISHIAEVLDSIGVQFISGPPFEIE